MKEEKIKNADLMPKCDPNCYAFRKYALLLWLRKYTFYGIMKTPRENGKRHYKRLYPLSLSFGSISLIYSDNGSFFIFCPWHLFFTNYAQKNKIFFKKILLGRSVFRRTMIKKLVLAWRTALKCIWLSEMQCVIHVGYIFCNKLI